MVKSANWYEKSAEIDFFFFVWSFLWLKFKFVSSFVCPSEFEYLKIDSNYMPKKIKYQNVNSRNT